jgi:hypothetical protein
MGLHLLLQGELSGLIKYVTVVRKSLYLQIYEGRADNSLAL